jgi:phage tail tape-measure protein
MATLYSGTLAAGATSTSITVVQGTIVGVEVSQPVYVLAANGAILAETGAKDAINIIPTNSPITVKAKELNTASSVVTVTGQ